VAETAKPGLDPDRLRAKSRVQAAFHAAAEAAAATKETATAD